MKPEESRMSMTLLLETVVLLIDTKPPWVCNIILDIFLQRKTFTLFREIALTWKVWFYICVFFFHIFLVFF